jgi:hypothetical protein
LGRPIRRGAAPIIAVNVINFTMPARRCATTVAGDVLELADNAGGDGGGAADDIVERVTTPGQN